MSMSFYPEQLRKVVVILDGLNRIDKELDEVQTEVPAEVYFEKVKLTDSDGSDLGTAVDEIGGAWSWIPPEVKV